MQWNGLKVGQRQFSEVAAEYCVWFCNSHVYKHSFLGLISERLSHFITKNHSQQVTHKIHFSIICKILAKHLTHTPLS